jgi:quinol monooxygenase YgiN
MKTSYLFLLLIMAFSFNSCNSKKSGENMQTTENKTNASVPDGKKMIVAKLSVKPEKVKDFIAAATDIIEKSNKENGCSFYQLYQDPYDSSRFIFVEEYKNQAAVDVHFSAEYFKAFSPKIAGFVTGPADIKVISIAKEEAK